MKILSKFSPKVQAVVALSMLTTLAHAQGNRGVGAIGQAAATFRSYQGPVQSLLYAIAAVIALVGAFNIYFKMQNGDQDVKKTILMTIGGCIAFVAMAVALPAFFS
jgi:conjugative transposon protein traE